ncbi:unnamed protein product, partial [Heterotrigona itama]
MNKLVAGYTNEKSQNYVNSNYMIQTIYPTYKFTINTLNFAFNECEKNKETNASENFISAITFTMIDSSEGAGERITPR